MLKVRQTTVEGLEFSAQNTVLEVPTGQLVLQLPNQTRESLQFVVFTHVPPEPISERVAELRPFLVVSAVELCCLLD